ncbi:ABC transporter ATP-binding protein [Actinoplanes sp. NEAU-A11]|uniref:ABC transporter ATP-binding protein n=2 Tax=Actinoplanes aureus TaxID=2792083 RepID=A0A931CI91_9ACTN|nr:ABC transporter ATP-binding protein [Actinoplanes aureus]
MNIAVVLPAVLLGRAVDTVLAYARGATPFAEVTRAVLLLVAGTLATEVPRIGKRYWLGVAKARIQATLRADAVRGVLGWPAERLHRTSVGDVMTRVIGDVDVIGTGVGEIIVETWDTVLFSLAFVTAMLLYDPTLSLWALAPVPIALVLAKLIGARVARRTLRARQADTAVTQLVQEGLTAARLLTVYGRRAAYSERVAELARARAGAELAAARLDTGLAPVYGTLVTAGIVPMVWIGGERVAAGSLTVGGFVAFLQLFVRFTGRAHRIPLMVNRVQAAAAAFSRIDPLLAAAAAPAGPASRWRRNHIDAPAVEPPVERIAAGPASVCLERVRFSYPGSAGVALADITLDIEPGSVVGITGPVGSGKSALARLIVGLHAPGRGRVRVDGQDPHTWTAAQRAGVGYVPQDYPAFSATVAENILLRGSASALGVDTAVAVSDLSVDVADMPDALSTQVGALGVRISGGQRQRIALARALAVSPRLLVLDDPFSAVDVDTEARIVAALREAVGPNAPAQHRATIVLCSTRLAAFPHADQVVVLDGGRVVEHGRHDELIAADGLYARIFHAQPHRDEPAASR